MKNRSILLTFVFTICAIGQSFSHYLWVETDANGTLGKSQEIRVHFGEYTYGVIEKVQGEAFPSVKEFSLWVVDASGKKYPLEVVAKENYYLAQYTPQTEGTHTVILNNDNIDVIDYTQYDFGIFKTHYHSIANIQVGNDSDDTKTQNANGLTIKRLAQEDEGVKLQVLYKEEPLAKNEVKVYVKDLWSKTLETDEDGMVSFNLPWDTKYIVETTKKEEVPGTYKGEEYEFVWHCATHFIKP